MYSMYENFLKCSVCGYPLSITPIHYHSTLGSICGRAGSCENIKQEHSDEIFERQFKIEEMVKNMIFPCAFRREGCSAELKGDTALNHEQACIFKVITVECPLYQENVCTWIGHYSELISHIKYQHEKYFKEALKFTLTPELDTKFLFSEMNRNIITVLFKHAPHNNNSIMRIMTDMNYKQRQENKFQICCSSGDSEAVFEAGQLESPLPSRRIFSEFILEIPYSSLNNLFKQSNEINISILLVPNKTLGILHQFECPVCTELMGPPIYLCTEGHNICSRCRHKLMECPLCRRIITSNRNLTLENICSIITGPCMYNKDGCSYIDSITKVKNHEPFCTMAERRCVIKTCKWIEKTSELNRHLKEEHTFKELERSYPYKIGMKFEQHMFIHDEKIFLMTLNSANEKSITYGIHCLGGKHHQYEYELRIIDPVVHKNMIILRNACRPIGYNFVDNSTLLLAIPVEMCDCLTKENNQINFMVKIHEFVG